MSISAGVDLEDPGKSTLGEGHVPTVYNYKPSGRGYYRQSGTPEHPDLDYVFLSPAALFCFGHGLNYTNFDYFNLEIRTRGMKEGEPEEISVQVSITGKVSGKEALQLYFCDEVSLVSTRVERLERFKKIRAGPRRNQIG